MYRQGSVKTIAFSGALSSFTAADGGIWDLGTVTNRWRNIYGTELDVRTTGLKDGVAIFGGSDATGKSIHLNTGYGTNKIASAGSAAEFSANAFVGDLVIDSINKTVIVDELVIGDGTAQVNITLTSTDGTEFTCGVNDAGALACS